MFAGAHGTVDGSSPSGARHCAPAEAKKNQGAASATASRSRFMGITPMGGRLGALGMPSLVSDRQCTARTKKADLPATDRVGFRMARAREPRFLRRNEEEDQALRSEVRERMHGG